MTRKSVFLGFGILLLLTVIAGGILYLLVRYEPNFYRQCTLPPGKERRQYAGEFFTAFTTIANNLRAAKRWDGVFTDQQINSFIQEAFDHSENPMAGAPAGLRESIPSEITNPRVVIEPQRLRLAFRFTYGTEPWSTIITLDLRARLVAKDPNVIVLELLGLHAGRLPISESLLMERISSIAELNKLELMWYRNGSNPVAVLRFPPTVQFTQLQLDQGKLVIAGEHSRSPAMLSSGFPAVATTDCSRSEHHSGFADLPGCPLRLLPEE